VAAAAPAVVVLAAGVPAALVVALAAVELVLLVLVVVPVLAEAAELVLAALGPVVPVLAEPVAEPLVVALVQARAVPVLRAHPVRLALVALAVRPWVVAVEPVSAGLERRARARPEAQRGRSRPHPTSPAQLEPVLLQVQDRAVQLRTEQVLMVMAQRATADGRTGTTTELALIRRRPAPTGCAQCISALTYSRTGRTVLHPHTLSSFPLISVSEKQGRPPRQRWRLVRSVSLALPVGATTLVRSPNG
jgi:hypothetical protein